MPPGLISVTGLGSHCQLHRHQAHLHTPPSPPARLLPIRFVNDYGVLRRLLLLAKSTQASIQASIHSERLVPTAGSSGLAMDASPHHPGRFAPLAKEVSLKLRLLLHGPMLVLPHNVSARTAAVLCVGDVHVSSRRVPRSHSTLHCSYLGLLSAALDRERLLCTGRREEAVAASASSSYGGIDAHATGASAAEHGELDNKRNSQPASPPSASPHSFEGPLPWNLHLAWVGTRVTVASIPGAPLVRCHA